MPRHTLRLTEAQLGELEALSGGNISEYIRRRLFGERAGLEAVLDRIDHLADDIAEGRLLPDTSHDDRGADIESLKPMLVELVLMFRGIAKPETLRATRAEMERRGITPWGDE